MNDDIQPPTLTDAAGMGGVNALGGFDYQLWDGLVRLPTWLVNPAFEELIFEGLEDLEARFFAPHAPRQRLVERYQAKSGTLTPAQVREILSSFQRFEESFPQTARVQTLVTPRLPPTVSWLGRDPLRVRRARPFYAPFQDVLAASDAKLRKDLVEMYGEPLGNFVAEAVEISERNLPDRDHALHAFGSALNSTFPTIDAGARQLEAAFEALSNLARRSIGTPMKRAMLIGAIENSLGRSLGFPVGFPLHVRSDRGEVNEIALEIDASMFSGGGGKFPESQRWGDELLGPLDHTARWLRESGFSRVALGGSYRLTTAMALGWSLRSAIGFELEIPTRGSAWATDDRPSAVDPPASWRIVEPEALHGDQLIVCVGILRDPSANLTETFGAPATAVLSAFLPEPLTSARTAQAGVSTVKRAVDAVAARLRPRSISLFLAGPAAFVVALGHRWNAMPPTQLHEFLAAEQRYVPTARLPPEAIPSCSDK